MLRSLASLTIVLLLCSVSGAAGLLVNDTFDNLNNWKDLSTAITWGGYAAGTSAWTTSGSGTGVLTLTTNAKANMSYSSATKLREFQCLDKQFATPVDHTQDAIAIRFRAKWQGTSDSSLSNEGSRLVVSLNYGYPSGGLDLTTNSKYNNFSQAWWAHPAYNLRIRCKDKDSIFVYGGSDDVGTDKYDGHFEKYYSGSTPLWWLPGFSAAPVLPPGDRSPNTNPPHNGVATAGMYRYSQTMYKDYLYVVTQSQQQLWYDYTGDGVLDLCGTQNITGVNGTGVDSMGFRCQFPSLEGVRIYECGYNANQALIDSFSAEVLLKGDANFDRHVDVVDLGVLATNYGLTGKAWQAGDFNGDGSVDVVDLGLLATSYGGSYSAADVVPEPATLSLMVLAAGAMTRRNRK
jgi:hypothetical protein